MKITLNEQKVPREGFGKDHLLSHGTVGRVYFRVSSVVEQS